MTSALHGSTERAFPGGRARLYSCSVAMYCCLWEFVVRPGRVEEFERRYGPRGEWSALFRRHPGYVRTDLLRDALIERRYVTLDLWDTRESFLEFRARHGNEYERLDSALEELTEKEAALGEFEVL